MHPPIWYQSAQTLANQYHQPTYIVTRQYGDEQEPVILFEAELTSTDYTNVQHAFLPLVARKAA